MIRGFYTALSGVVAAMTRQAVVADNIANVNTVGFKQSRTLQTDYELSIMNAVGPELGLLGSGTVPAGLRLDISQGPLYETGVQTDLAVEGDGLFVVRTGNGIAYTRAGNFQTDATGMLVTEQGYPVLDVAGHTISPGLKFTVAADGTIAETGQRIALVAWPAGGADARSEQHRHVHGDDRADLPTAPVPAQRPRPLAPGQHPWRRHPARPAEVTRTARRPASVAFRGGRIDVMLIARHDPRGRRPLTGATR